MVRSQMSVPVAARALSRNTVMVLAGVGISFALMMLPVPESLSGTYPYIFGPWSAVSPMDWAVLALLAGFTVTIGMMLAGAYKIAPPATVATFEYSYLVFVALWDILFFGLTPTPATLLGMAMIVAAGLCVMRGRR